MHKLAIDICIPQKLTKERALIVKLDELSVKVSTLPWGDWSEDDRNDLTNALTSIYKSTMHDVELM